MCGGAGGGDRDPGMRRRRAEPIAKCRTCKLVGIMVRRQQSAPRAASQVGWSGAVIAELRTLPLQHLPLNSHFQQGFSLSSPTNQATGGAQSGERDTGRWSPRGLSLSRHSEWTLTCPSTAVLRTAVPTHGHRVNIRQAPWAAGSGRTHRGQRVAWPPSPPGASSPSPLTCYLHGAACLG